MKNRRSFSRCAGSLGLALWLAAGCPPLLASSLKEVATATAQKLQKSVVSVRLVLKTRMGQRENEQKIEIVGTVIDPSGLTIVSASSVDPAAALRGMFGTSPLADRFKVDSNVAETVLILDDSTEVPADVVLKDPELDFAFIRPRDGTRAFAAITLPARATPPQMLDEVFVLGRLGRSENRSLALTTGAIRSIVKGPRTYYICDDGVTLLNAGTLVFGAAGSPLGVCVTKSSPSQLSGGLFSMFSMGGGPTPALPIPIVRPVEDLLEIAAQARQVKPEEKKAEPPPADKSPDKTPE